MRCPYENYYVAKTNLFQDSWLDRQFENEARDAYLDANEEVQDFDAETYEWN